MIITTDGIRKLTAKSWNFKRFVDKSVTRHINHDWAIRRTRIKS